jgi:hypothetical protein
MRKRFVICHTNNCGLKASKFRLIRTVSSNGSGHDIVCYCKLCHDGLDEIGFVFSKEVSEEEATLFLVHES